MFNYEDNARLLTFVKEKKSALQLCAIRGPGNIKIVKHPGPDEAVDSGI